MLKSLSELEATCYLLAGGSDSVESAVDMDMLDVELEALRFTLTRSFLFSLRVPLADTARVEGALTRKECSRLSGSRYCYFNTGSFFSSLPGNLNSTLTGSVTLT
eukprot:TRINITY_DN16715_c0_g1_i1.p1 TRINITY_DN16715_c0_g1~~TRINITY_DN16715_c0_g1_i1.p1  ORF type:complete len:105 (-),score=8.65 TRINITY_DN16715_c0_g1_i1:92-406(-)